MRKHIIYFLAIAAIVVIGCQKELSFEGSNVPAEGSLQSELTGDCLPKSVNGTYEVNKALVPATNTISVTVNVTSIGDYVVNTDTVNGYFFRATGIFTTLGANVVTLRGNGTPFATGTNNFVVAFDSTYCDIQVDVLPAGAGGPAEYTIVSTGTPANCSGATAAGTYIIGSPLNSTNTVPISVNVTKIGTYTISSTATNGMTFSKTAAFLATGAATVTLEGSGTPTAPAGAITVPLVAGAPVTSTCNFVVNTVAGAVFTLDCATATASGVHGTYQAGVPLTAANTIDIPVTAVTTPGLYSISTSVNGMTFVGSGNMTAGTTSITLTGSGTPTNGPTTSSLTVPSGTGTCSIDIPVIAGATIAWKFTEGSVYQGGFDNGNLQSVSVPPFVLTTYTFQGSDASGENIIMILADLAGGITNGETYATTSTTANNVSFLVLNGATTLYQADATMSGLTFKVTVTSHNTTTKTVTGTFAGTVKDGSGNTKTISTGTFTGTYP